MTRLTSTNKSNQYSTKILLALILLSSIAACVHILQHPHNEALAVPKEVRPGGQVCHNPNQKLATPCRLSRRQRNFLAKMINGNRGTRGTGMKLIDWNKVPSFLRNKNEEIETLIANHHPHVLGLSEANLRSDHDLDLVQQPDYDLHLCPTSNNPALSISRVVVYTHKSLVVKRRTDLEDERISAIWLEVGLPNKKKILVCQGYREWKYLGQADQSSGTLAAQLERWCLFLKLWEQGLQEGKEVIVMMDANLDFLK